VVLPTPPFWLVMEMILQGMRVMILRISQPDEAAIKNLAPQPGNTRNLRQRVPVRFLHLVAQASAG